MDRERLIALVNHVCKTKAIHKEFAEKTGLPRKTVQNLMDGRQRFNEDHIKAVTEAYPEYKYWFVFGETESMAGQISPEIEETRASLKETGTDT